MTYLVVCIRHRYFCLGCPNHKQVGDSFCDDDTNIPMCAYDGGDCCLDMPESNLYCEDCKCYTPYTKVEEYVELNWKDFLFPGKYLK